MIKFDTTVDRENYEDGYVRTETLYYPTRGAWVWRFEIVTCTTEECYGTDTVGFRGELNVPWSADMYEREEEFYDSDGMIYWQDAFRCICADMVDAYINDQY